MLHQSLPRFVAGIKTPFVKKMNFINLANQYNKAQICFKSILEPTVYDQERT